MRGSKDGASQDQDQRDEQGHVQNGAHRTHAHLHLMPAGGGARASGDDGAPGPACKGGPDDGIESAIDMGWFRHLERPTQEGTCRARPSPRRRA